MKASELKIGDKIMVDMGYNGHEMEELVTVNKVELKNDLFGVPSIIFQVKRYSGETISLHSYAPHWEVPLAKY